MSRASSRHDERGSSAPGFQTVRLAPGRHETPRDGVCAAELASMLAGERFSDRPRTACPAVTAFVRGYNDGVDDDHRQDLYAVAAMLVGSAADADTVHERMWRCIAFARELRPRRLGLLGPRLSYESDLVKCESAGRHAGRLARRHEHVHRHVLGFVAELLGYGESSERTATSVRANAASSSASVASPSPASSERQSVAMNVAPTF
jgi:hypothetical protein